ncbi:MAG TPA: TRIC cation channel family protein [Opitutaceae bacterium]|nr:TRIC cation channel family protein [Opitutaceae bacterium]
MITALDLAGMFVFALSGAHAAARKGMDVVGMFTLGLVTAIGGGTVRSLLIGDYPVPFLRAPWPFASVLLATLIVFLGWQQIERLSKPIRLFDAIGLGVYMALGVTISLDLGQPWWSALLLGCATAVSGGIFRDILRNEVPFVLLPGEFYATTVVLGAVAFLTLESAGAPRQVAMVTGAALTITTRLFAMYFRWSTTPARE